MCLFKSATRLLVIGGLAAGAAVLVAGPDRIGALATQARQSINAQIDQQIDDPVAMRQQLKKLAAGYPERIGAYQNELADLRSEITSYEREFAVASRVVELASADLEILQDALAKAEEVRTDQPSAVIRITHDQHRLPLDQAYSKATQIARTVDTYKGRAAHAEQGLDSLRQQESVLVELIDELEAEHAQFQSWLWKLESEIDLYERQERLVEMVEDRKRVIEDEQRYDAGNLDSLLARMDQMQAEQRARLEHATSRVRETNYEDRAAVMLRSELSAKELYDQTLETARDFEVEDDVILIEPDNDTRQPSASDEGDTPVAQR